MRIFSLFLLLLGSSIILAEETKNPLIDYSGFKQIVLTKDKVREKKRLSEAEFIKALESKEYVLLDARSEKNFQLRHIAGAVNLPITEFTAETLEKVIPKKETKILIYCNNNFNGSRVAFAPKRATASLNIMTQVNLASYGYHDVYELAPLLDVKKTKIQFAGTEVELQQAQLKR